MQRVFLSKLKWCESSLCSSTVVRRYKSTAENNVLDSASSDPSIPYSHEEIERMRDKSRLPEEIKKRYIRKELPDLPHDYNYMLKNLRSHYGTFGKNSGLNPGLCWPTPEELDLKLEYDALAYEPLETMVKSIKKRKNAEASARRKKEEEVEKNMIKLAKLEEEARAKQAKKEAAAKAQLLKKELIINEIREKLGFHIDSSDPRFREIILKREEEQKKASKEAKRKQLKKDKVDYIKQLAVEAGLKPDEPRKRDDSSDDDEKR